MSLLNALNQFARSTLVRKDKPGFDDELFYRQLGLISLYFTLEPRLVFGLMRNSLEELKERLLKANADVEEAIMAQGSTKFQEADSPIVKAVLETKDMIGIHDLDNLNRAANITLRNHYSQMKPYPGIGEVNVYTITQTDYAYLEDNLTSIFKLLTALNRVASTFDLDEAQRISTKYILSNLRNLVNPNPVVMSLMIKALISLRRVKFNPFQPLVRSHPTIDKNIPEGSTYKARLVGDSRAPEFVTYASPFWFGLKETFDFIAFKADGTSETLSLTIPELGTEATYRHKLTATFECADPLPENVVLTLTDGVRNFILTANAGDSYLTVLSKFNILMKAVNPTCGAQAYLGQPNSKKITLYSDYPLRFVNSLTYLGTVSNVKSSYTGFTMSEVSNYTYSAQDLVNSINYQIPNLASLAEPEQYYQNYLDNRDIPIYGKILGEVSVEGELNFSQLTVTYEFPKALLNYRVEVFGKSYYLHNRTDNKFYLIDRDGDVISPDIKLPKTQLTLYPGKRVSLKFEEFEYVIRNSIDADLGWLNIATRVYNHIEFVGKSKHGKGEQTLDLNKLGVQRGDVLSIFYPKLKIQTGGIHSSGEVTTTNSSLVISGNFIRSVKRTKNLSVASKDGKRLELNIWLPKTLATVEFDPLTFSSYDFENAEVELSALPAHLFVQFKRGYGQLTNTLNSLGTYKKFLEDGSCRNFFTHLSKKDILVELYRLHGVLVPILQRNWEALEPITLSNGFTDNALGVSVKGFKYPKDMNIFSVIYPFAIPSTLEEVKSSETVLALLRESGYDRASDLLVNLELQRFFKLRPRDAKYKVRTDNSMADLLSGLAINEDSPLFRQEDKDWETETL